MLGRQVGVGLVMLAAVVTGHVTAQEDPGGGGGGPGVGSVTVTPDAGVDTAYSNTSGNTVSFTVKNTWTKVDAFSLFCARTGAVTSCSLSLTYVQLNPGQATTIVATFAAGGSGSGSVVLTAAAEMSTASDQGDYHIVVDHPPTYAVTVTTTPGVDSIARNASKAVFFRVHNTGDLPATFTLGCAATSLVTCSWVEPPTVALESGQDSLIAAVITAGSTSGAAAVTVSATGSGVADSATQTVTVYQPAALSVAFTNGDRLERSGCVTVGAGPNGMIQCSDLVYAHSLPGYRSMNRARAVTLMFHSGTVQYRPRVVVDYTTFAGDPVPDRLRLQVKRVSDGAILKDVYYTTVGFVGSVTQTHRLSVTPSLWTGAHDLEVILTPRVGGVWQSPLVAPIRVLSVSRSNSMFGAGWWIAGIDRIYVQSGGHLLLVKGDASLAYFEKVGSTYVAPPGEYSEITKVGSVYRRLLSDRRTTVWYASGGLVDSIVDTNPTRNKATYTWQLGGPWGAKLLSITDPSGQAITFGYASNGRVSQINIPAVGAVQLHQSKDASGGYYDLDSIVDPDGFVSRFTYYSWYRLASSTARGTGQVTYRYDAAFRVDSVSAPAGVAAPAVQFRAWELVGHPAPGKGSASNPATPGWTDSVRTIVSRWRGASGQYQDTAFFRVDRYGFPTDVNLPGLRPTAIVRDSAGRPIHVYGTGGGGADVLQEYTADGRLARSMALAVDQRRDTTRYEYDPTWRSVTRIIPPLRDSTVLSYDAWGRRQWVEDALGHRTTFAYTARGQLAQITEPYDVVPTTYTYDPTTFNLTHVADSAGSVTYGYDPANQSDLVSVQDAHDNETTYSYDAMKRPRFVTRSGVDAEPSTIEYRYDDVNRVRTQIDPRGVASTWTADPAGRLIARCVPATSCETTSYGDGINPTRTITRASDWIEQAFDAAGRVTERRLGFYGEDDVITYGYDSDGNLRQVVNQHARVTMAHDWYGRLVYERQDIRLYTNELDWRGTEARYAYDRNGRRSRAWLGDPVAWIQNCVPVPDGPPCDADWSPVFTDSLSYAYDAVGNLSQLSNTFWAGQAGGGNRTWTFLYDDKNRLTETRYPKATGGTLNVYQAYNNDDQLVRHWSSAAIGLQDSIRWNAVGNPERVSLWGGNRVDTFTYDGLGRLRIIGGTHEWDTYGYDRNGNRLTSTQSAMTYNLRGQLTDKVAGSCSTTYAYDLNGNQTSQTPTCSSVEQRTMEYNKGDQMTRSVTLRQVGGELLQEERTFWYDGLGRRILLLSEGHTASGQRAADYGMWRYFWFGDHVGVKTYNGIDSADADLWWPAMTRNAQGQLDGRGEWFFYAPGVDNLLASWNYYEVNPSPRHLFFRDWRGSVVKVTNEHGTALGLSPDTYAAFGAPGGTMTPDKERGPGYNGHESAGGLVYMRNRWYDPNTGRFTQEDPIGFAGGSNIYGYVGNNPVSFIDPFGLWIRVTDALRPVAADARRSAFFDRTFSALDRARFVHLTVSECQGNPACSEGRLGMEGGGYIDLRTFSQNAFVDNVKYKGRDLVERFVEEVLHAAVMFRNRVNTGVTCFIDESDESCTDRWKDVVMKEYDEREKKEEGK